MEKARSYLKNANSIKTSKNDEMIAEIMFMMKDLIQDSQDVVIEAFNNLLKVQ